ncbi:MAG: universal stress protein [Sediminispirochaetaceae bacterium]
MLQKALVPLSFRESTDQVSGMCEFLQMLGTREAVLLHIGSDRGRAGAHNRRRLEEYAEHIEELGFRTEKLVRRGSVQQQIILASAELGADYISIVFRKKSWIARAILGSNVKDVIRLSDSPVFVYKNPRRRQRADRVFRVLYATSLQGRDDSLLTYIRNEDFQADEITFLYAGRRAPDPVVEKQRQDKAERDLKVLEERCGLGQHSLKHLSVLGSPRRQILKTARGLPADLVLLGKADASASREPVLGSTAEEVSYNAPCSVLIIPKNGGAAQ